jgi:hypothetical protein
VKKTEERVKKAFHHEKKRRNVSTTNACNATTPDRACMCGVVLHLRNSIPVQPIVLHQPRKTMVC